MTRDSRGFVTAIALLLIMVLAIMVPIFVLFSHYEARWSVKSTKAVTAFQLAEAAVERGYLQISLSTSNWDTIQNGQIISGYHFDARYSDLPGGQYAIWIASGSTLGEAQIIGVGQDALQRETRSIKVVFARSDYGDVAVQAGGGVTISGSNYVVNWGGVRSPAAVTASPNTYPQFWSGAGVDYDTNGATPPNCDSPGCCQWHSYYPNISTPPQVDFDYYKSSATTAGTGPCGAYYSSGNRSISGCTDISGNAYYIGGDLNLGTNNHIIGTVIVMGSLNLPNGNYGNGSETVSLPQNAWKQYCLAWATYKTFDPTGPSAFPGINSGYVSPSTTTVTLNKVFLHGFIYIGSNFTNPGGGGNGVIIGSMQIGGSATLSASSSAGIYFDPVVAANMHTTSIGLGHKSWQEVDYALP